MITLYFNDFTLQYKSYVQIEVEDGAFIIRQTKIHLNPSSGGAVYIPDTIEPDGINGKKYFSILIKELIKIEYNTERM